MARLAERMVVQNVVSVNNSRGFDYAGRQNVISDVMVFNNPDHGIRVPTNPFATQDGRNNILLNITVGNNGRNRGGKEGLIVNQSAVLINATVLNSGGSGVRVTSTGSTLMNVASINAAVNSLHINQSTDNLFINMVLTNSTDNSVASDRADLFVGPNSPRQTFSGVLRLSAHTNRSCRVWPTTVNAGIQILGGFCSNQDASDAAITIGPALGDLVGPISGDAVNTSDTTGTASADSITDWTGFARGMRGWGLDGAAGARLGNCATGQTCRIYDLALQGDPSILRGSIPAPGGNDAVDHEWEVTTEAECNGIDGATWTAGTSRCASVFLRNAYERLGDGIGNDNGLCESDETCIVTPNVGAYQGHGALMSAGMIGAGGMVERVTLMRFESNGY